MPQKIFEQLKHRKIKITKYNYCFDQVVQNFNCYEAFIEISDSGNYLKIFNVKIKDSFEKILANEKLIEEENHRIRERL